MVIKDVQQRHASGGSTEARVAQALGWFSIALGAAEVFAPDAVAGLIGVRRSPKNRALLRTYGARELAAGVGILTQRRPTGWLWGRVAGDAVDLTSLLSAMGGRGNDDGRLTVAMASVVGVTAADVWCAQRLSEEPAGRSGESQAKVVRTIIIDRPAEEIYRFWHDFENLPRFMTYLKSVRYTGDRRTHWIATGPAGMQLAWDADTVADEPNRMIAWRSVEGSSFQNSGSVRFERAPGDRGTLVRVEIDYSGNRAAAAAGKLLQMDLGRRVSQDLRKLKQVHEVGEVTQSEASVHAGRHAAQPEPVYQH